MVDLANKPVFPLENPRLLEDGSLFKQHPGMTLREHYAGLAMQGLLTNLGSYTLQQPSDVAFTAVQCADALVAELAKTEGGAV